jgi:hypothetical protein
MAKVRRSANSSTAVATSNTRGGALSTWQQRLEDDAKKAVQQEAAVGTGNFITQRGGILTYQGTPLPDDELNAVIIDSMTEHNFYTDSFDPDNPAIPVCFAFGRDGAEMVPHDASEDKQNATCAGCPQMVWGTATDAKGKPRRGKACQQRRRLMLIPEDVLKGGPEAVKRSEVAFYKCSVTSVKAWAAYVKVLAATYKRPPYAFVTKMKLLKDPDVQFRMTFNMEASIENPELLEALTEKAAAHEEDMFRPYERQEQTDAGAGRARPAPAPRRAAKTAARRPAKY